MKARHASELWRKVLKPFIVESARLYAENAQRTFVVNAPQALVAWWYMTTSASLNKMSCGEEFDGVGRRVVFSKGIPEELHHIIGQDGLLASACCGAAGASDALGGSQVVA